jgi:HAD superfamily hydrolase (TIGR01509 family)
MPDTARSPRAALLDVDGTLVDSNDQHARAWVDAFREAGHDVPYERVRPLIGMGGDKVMPKLTGVDHESDEGKRISARRSEIFLEHYVPQLKGLPGARPLLERMQRDGLTLVVATSAKKGEYERLVRVAGVEGIVDDQTTADDASRSKPDPDIIVAALKKAEVPPAEAVMLGDTPYDIQAARAAGVGCVALRSGGWRDADLAGALAVYDDPADLLAHFDASPFAAGGAPDARAR